MHVDRQLQSVLIPTPRQLVAAAGIVSTGVHDSHAFGPSLMTTLKPGSRFSEASSSSSSKRHKCQAPISDIGKGR